MVRLLRVERAIAPDQAWSAVHVADGLRGCALQDLPPELPDLALLCRHFAGRRDEELLYLCSGAAMHTEGMLLPRFLTYRYRALAARWTWQEHALEVARVALQLAYRYQDREVVRDLLADPTLACQLTRSDDPAFDEAAVARLLARERHLQGRLAERTAQLRRSPFGGKRRPAARGEAPPARRKAPKPRRKRRDATPQLPFLEAASPEAAGPAQTNEGATE